MPSLQAVGNEHGTPSGLASRNADRSGGADGHAPNEITWKQDLVTCAALYAAVPGLYKPENKDGSATSFRQELTGNDIK